MSPFPLLDYSPPCCLTTQHLLQSQNRVRHAIIIHLTLVYKQTINYLLGGRGADDRGKGRPSNTYPTDNRPYPYTIWYARGYTLLGILRNDIAEETLNCDSS